MQNQALKFKEVEHKFLVPIDFDPTSLFRRLVELGPERHYSSEVRDTYFLLSALPGCVMRHRYDKFIQQLTLKSGAGDNEVRTEVNLDLVQDGGTQLPAVRAFLEPLGLFWSGSLKKDIEVYYFADVEIVYYIADFEGRTQKCVEIEVREASSLGEALEVLAAWEKRLGLDGSRRSKSSIVELLILPTLSEQHRAIFQGSK